MIDKDCGLIKLKYLQADCADAAKITANNNNNKLTPIFTTLYLSQSFRVRQAFDTLANTYIILQKCVRNILINVSKFTVKVGDK